MFLHIKVGENLIFKKSSGWSVSEFDVPIIPDSGWMGLTSSLLQVFNVNKYNIGNNTSEIITRLQIPKPIYTILLVPMFDNHNQYYGLLQVVNKKKYGEYLDSFSKNDEELAIWWNKYAYILLSHSKIIEDSMQRKSYLSKFFKSN